MSFADWGKHLQELKDLEAERDAWAEEQAELRRKEARVKRMKKARPAMFQPDRPVVYVIEVVINARPVDGGELIELCVGIETISELEAELKARRQIEALGYLYRGVVSTKRGVK